MNYQLNYQLKYFKYKNKYLELKKQLGGVLNYSMQSIDPKSLKDEFLQYNNTNLHYNENILKFPNIDEGLTFGTYNVHYFTDVYEATETYQGIINDIRVINADIMMLQEVLIGKDIKIKEGVIVNSENFYNDLAKFGYNKIIICNNVPSWFKGIYCNAFLIHDRITSKCKDRNVCSIFKEFIHTFDKSKTTVMVSGAHQGTQETRCYLYVVINHFGNNYHIYGTHLDVASEEERLNQIKQIIEDAKKHNASTDYIIIMGDFNTLDLNKTYDEPYKADYFRTNKFTKDNKLVTAQLKSNGYIDIFQHYSSHISMSAWNTTLTDFIFIKNGNNDKLDMKKYSTNIFFTKNSDHLPILLHLYK